MRLIDGDALKDWSEIVPLTGDGGIDINDFDEKLKSMPTVDAVPVIRCQDCKWYYRGGATCMFWDGANGMCADDFCGKAERAEE